MSEQDFMPLDGWDHLEVWVGNAKQAAYFYEHAFGFTQTAYAGPETGVRDRASYVLEQGEIRFVVTSGLRADSEVCKWAATKGDRNRSSYSLVRAAILLASPMSARKMISTAPFAPITAICALGQA